MAEISHESLICSDLSTNELKRLESCSLYHRSDFDSSIMIDSYLELPNQSSPKLRKRSSSVHILYDKGNDENTQDTTLSYIYKKIAAFFFVFNRFSLSDYMPSDMPTFSADINLAPFVRSFSMLYDLRLKDKIYDTMDSLIKYNRKATDRLVAMITSVPLHLDKFDFYKYFSNLDFSLAESFALFIENPEEPDSTNEGTYSLDDIPDDIQCELVNKRSNEVISESGPYRCVYQRTIDSIADSTILNELLYGVSVKKGKVRFFHRMKGFGKKDENRIKQGNLINVTPYSGTEDSLNYFIKQRFSTFTDYLSRRMQYTDGNNSNKWKAKTYFNVFSRKRTGQTPEELDDSAKERFQEHIRMHTLHWNEVQYDDIEIVLRDGNHNSIVKLPYSCTIM